MIKIIKQFESDLLTDEFITIIQNELKAFNLNPKGVTIYFRNYPTDATCNIYNIPEEIMNSGLNTLVFDTDSNALIVYVASKAAEDYVIYTKLLDGSKSVILKDDYSLSYKDGDEEVPLYIISKENDNLFLGDTNLKLLLRGSDVDVYYNNEKLIRESILNLKLKELEDKLTTEFNEEVKEMKWDIGELTKRVVYLEQFTPVDIKADPDEYRVAVGQSVKINIVGNTEDLTLDNQGSDLFNVNGLEVTGLKVGEAECKITGKKEGQADKDITVKIFIMEYSEVELDPEEVTLCHSKMEIGEVEFTADITSIDQINLVDYEYGIAEALIDFTNKKITITPKNIGRYRLGVEVTEEDKLPITKYIDITIKP